MRGAWTATALAQREAIWLVLADRSIDHVDRVEARLSARTGSLAGAPLQGRPLGRSDRRRLSIPDVQYVIHYRISADAIEIIGVRSTAQDEQR